MEWAEPMTTRVDQPHRPYPARALTGADAVQAANDDATPPRVPLSVGPGGWDPYEIWARRVRDPRAGRSTPGG